MRSYLECVCRGCVAAALPGLIVSALAGCGSTPPPAPAKATVGDGPPAQASKPEPLPAPDFVITPGTFYDEHMKDGIGAVINKYDGKVVEITGPVDSFQRQESAPDSFTLGAIEPGVSQRLTVCNTRERKPWLKCGLGQQVKARGRVRGGLLSAGYAIFDCEFQVVAGDAPIPLTVEQLLKELAEPSAAAKYEGKAVLLTGDYVSTKNSRVELKGDGKRTVFCSIGILDDAFAEKLPAGESITLMGKPEISRESVLLRSAFLTKGSTLPKD